MKQKNIIKSIQYATRGFFSLLVFTLNTALCCIPLFPITIAKIIIPINSWKQFCTKLLHGLAYIWTFINVNGWINNQGISFHTNGLEKITKNKRHLVIVNHQSWTDVTIIQKLLYTRIPLLTFFIKKELIWIPLLGFAWWALDFPFMKRHSKETLLKKPHLKGIDLKQAFKTSQKLKTAPVSIMNFPEGTRFTKEKNKKQNYPYTYLLMPKAGGIAMIINSLKEKIDTIINVTIIYPDKKNNFWCLLSGQINEIYIDFEKIKISKKLYGDYENDKAFKKTFQEWLNTVWAKKDKKIDTILKVQ